jgi:hypothetical protein
MTGLTTFGLRSLVLIGIRRRRIVAYTCISDVLSDLIF